MRLACASILACALGSACTGELAPGDQGRAPTTPGALAVQNLSSQIEGLEAALARAPGRSALRRDLVSLLLARAHYTGSYEDFDTALAAAERGAAADPDDPDALAARAAALGAVHHFEAALGDLEAAGALEPTGSAGEIFLALGRDPEGVLAAREERAGRYPSYDSYVALGNARSALGDYEGADAAYAHAAAIYRDVSPLPLAWVSFQRGLMWAERADQPGRARAFYQRAVELVPDYVVANVHLAELEMAAGEVDAALSRLRRIAPRTGDPEPWFRLSEYAGIETPEGAAAAERAREGYDRLLARHRLAFAHHAAEMYLGPAGDDPERALELALENLEHRKDDAAYSLSIHAALAAERFDLACDLATAEHPIQSVILDGWIAEGKNACRSR